MQATEITTALKARFENVNDRQHTRPVVTIDGIEIDLEFASIDRFDHRVKRINLSEHFNWKMRPHFIRPKSGETDFQFIERLCAKIEKVKTKIEAARVEKARQGAEKERIMAQAKQKRIEWNAAIASRVAGNGIDVSSSCQLMTVNLKAESGHRGSVRPNGTDTVEVRTTIPTEKLEAFAEFMRSL